jgi:hypothetical protein
MEVWLFGNTDLETDALPVKLKPELERLFPKLAFTVRDPLDEWPEQDKLIIIDTVRGLTEVRAFVSLGSFQSHPFVTMHDFDLLAELAWRQKMNKLPPFVVLGVPEGISAKQALEQLTSLLGQYAG